MTSVYRINYHLRAHKRDPLIEFIKGMLLTPFILHATPTSQLPSSDKPRDPTTPGGGDDAYVTDMSTWLTETQAAATPGSGSPAPLDLNLDANGPPVLRRNSFAMHANVQRYAEVMTQVEELVNEHIAMQAKGLEKYSRLRRLVPTVGTFFTPLPLRESFLYANSKHAIASRKYVPPSFNEIRRILNTAQIRASAPHLRFITFDGDMTLYPDGQTFAADSMLITQIVGLLQRGITVAIVTAAGYGSNAARYQERISGLLQGMAGTINSGHPLLTADQATQFYVVGGECNYLFRCTPEFTLRYIPDHEYESKLRAWNDDDIQRFLTVAEANLRQCVHDMKLDAQVLRKERAVGIVPQSPLDREQLDECALSTQQCLLQYNHASTPDQGKIPFCAFNGGSDVWVDVGNKLIGVQVLQEHLGFSPRETLHVGDQFLSTGNDIATRTACCTCWIINPQETHGMLDELMDQLRRRGAATES
ncbi:IMP 5'-nucleotidase [Dimargaris verticillata]|uniref:IMP-specific 5'-nucleotidase 1 n=1 Tax=Dimargaris verticillata TaxID=2761393 RepID=A0A9W8B360_9FUNG|nr:IMP 5'-nucleotidase [Dimargaris verticillata]